MMCRPLLRRAWRALPCALSAALTLLLAACGSTPLKPVVPPAFGADWQVPDGFRAAQPADDRIPADWWRQYGDPVLESLEVRVPQANQTLAQADAQYRQAQAVLASTQSSLYPSATLNLSANRSQQPILISNGGLANPPASNLFTLSTQAAWEPDLWGAVHDNVLSSRKSADASRANRAAVLLSLQASLAASYFQLRVDDAILERLEQAERADADSLRLTEDRFRGGVAARSDVSQAQTQLETARAQLQDQRVTRALREHAIAVLVGAAAQDFHIDRIPWSPPLLPAVPLGLPSGLLERRPDFANAERQVQAAAAKLNAAHSAFYPLVTLNASVGFESKVASRLLSLPKSFWSIGPAISQYILDGGNHTALLDQAVSALDLATASYRETVLEGFQAVEDNLVSVALLEQEQARYRAAAEAARETLQQLTLQYRAGTVGYLNVLTAQTALLAAETNELAVESRKDVAHVTLIRQLGGGWQDVEPERPAIR